MYVNIFFPLTKVIPIMFEHTNIITTYYQTLQTWIGHDATRYHTRCRTFSLSLTWLGYDATRYHNFNVLPHTLPYIFSKFNMVCDYLQRFTARYRQIYKKISIF